MKTIGPVVNGVIAFCASAVFAAHPFITDDAGVVPDRAFEIEGVGGSDLQGSADGCFVIKSGTYAHPACPLALRSCSNRANR